MYNKFVRAFLFDPKLRSQTLFFAGGFIVILFQLKIIGTQIKELSRAQSQKALVAKIPSLEKTVRAHTIMTENMNKLAKVQLILEGATIKEGVPYALIGGIVYAEGDTIGNYTVEKILMDEGGKAILKDQETQEIKILHVPMPK